jgi:hypothetical protein
MRKRLFSVALLPFWAIAMLLANSCSQSTPPPSSEPSSRPTQSLGSIEVVAKLLEIPEGAIFQRELYDYATVLKYEVLSVARGPLEKGAIIYVGHYNPWKSRADAADNRVRNIGGTLRQFRAGQRHHLALEPSMEDQFMGGVVDKYFGTRTGLTYWAVWTELSD